MRASCVRVRQRSGDVEGDQRDIDHVATPERNEVCGKGQQRKKE